MWTVKKLEKDQYQRYDPRKQRLLGDPMTYEQIVQYCKDRPTDLFARNFLMFIVYIESITDYEKPE